MVQDEEQLERLQIIQHQMGEVDQHLATKLLKQSGMEDEHQLDQEIQLLQDRVTKTRQKMAASAAAAANPGEVTSNDNF